MNSKIFFFLFLFVSNFGILNYVISEPDVSKITSVFLHRENYFVAGGGDYNGNLTNQIKFQFSYKYEIINDLWGTSFHGAYTQLSYLQPNAGNNDYVVVPDTTYEPEFFFQKDFNSDFVSYFRFGLRHRSNGQGSLGEVYWGDRLFVETELQLSNTVSLNLQTWNTAEQVGINQELDDYFGMAQLRLLSHVGDIGLVKDLSVSFLVRPGVKSSLSTPYQVSLYFQLFNKDLRYPYLQIQYWNGTGEYLTYYTMYTNRLRVGASISI